MPKSRRPVSDAEATDKEIRATCKILWSVAKTFPKGSATREAIREARDAFVYLRLHETLKKSYAAFQQASTKPLTKAQKQVLKRAGVIL